jgi:hypothetical protein
MATPLLVAHRPHSTHHQSFLIYFLVFLFFSRDERFAKRSSGETLGNKSRKEIFDSPMGITINKTAA